MVTNVDDIVVLTLLFSKVTSAVRALPLIAGQILGFGALVLRVCGKTAPKGVFPILTEQNEFPRAFFDVSGPQNAQIKAFRPVQAA